MNKNKIKYAVIIAGILLAANLPINIVSAWGPERPTYTNESPASYATFNSITDNVAIGDERNFVRIGEVGSSEPYVDEIEFVPGKEYEIYIYYHNDAASNTNSTGYGMATNTRVSSGYSTTLSSGERGMVSGIITWSYVDPSDDEIKTGKVWDEAYFTTKSNNITIRFKAASAVIHNSGEANGSVLPTTMFSEEGTPIGFNKLAGTIPGCAEYSGYITYTVVVEGEEAPPAESEDCATNPDLPECKDPEEPEKNCKTNPEMKGCQELPNTGPLEIIMAIVILFGIGGGGFYLYRTRKTLRTVEDVVSGKDSSQKPDDMV